MPNPAPIVYRVVYDDTANRHSSKRYRTEVTAEGLAGKIRSLQARGRIIVSVEAISGLQ